MGGQNDLGWGFFLVMWEQHELGVFPHPLPLPCPGKGVPYLGIGAGVREEPERAVLVTERAHDGVVGITDLLAGRKEKRSQGGQGCLRATCRAGWDVHLAFPRALPHLAGTENSSPSCHGCQPSHGSKNQQVGVPAQPGKVQGHLLSKIAPRTKGEVGDQILGVTRKCLWWQYLSFCGVGSRWESWIRNDLLTEGLGALYSVPAVRGAPLL